MMIAKSDKDNVRHRATFHIITNTNVTEKTAASVPNENVARMYISNVMIKNEMNIVGSVFIGKIYVWY